MLHAANLAWLGLHEIGLGLGALGGTINLPCSLDGEGLWS